MAVEIWSSKSATFKNQMCFLAHQTIHSEKQKGPSFCGFSGSATPEIESEQPAALKWKILLSLKNMESNNKGGLHSEALDLCYSLQDSDSQLLVFPKAPYVLTILFCPLFKRKKIQKQILSHTLVTGKVYCLSLLTEILTEGLMTATDSQFSRMPGSLREYII